eukprot:scaffold59280_cov33-Phaeocystis_antarctica.AAC.1
MSSLLIGVVRWLTKPRRREESDSLEQAGRVCRPRAARQSRGCGVGLTRYRPPQQNYLRHGGPVPSAGKMTPEDGGSGRDSRLPTPVGQVMNPLALLTRQIFADHTLAATDLCTRPFTA